MTDYLAYTLTDDENFIETFDEVPLWSAAFGLLLFKHLELKPYQQILDIGSGAGFPLLELAGRFGPSVKLYGLDPWINANKRAAKKIKNYQLTNVQILQGTAEHIPLQSAGIDLIVSNLGINNFENPSVVFNECYRVLQPGGKLILTSNITGHWKELYAVFYTTLSQLGMENLIPVLKTDEQHRGTLESISHLFTNSGFKISRHFEEHFEMKFLNGSAFLNHHFVKLGWLTTWIKLFPENLLKEIFTTLEENLNAYARSNNGLSFTVPMLYMEGEKNSQAL